MGELGGVGNDVGWVGRLLRLRDASFRSRWFLLSSARLGVSSTLGLNALSICTEIKLLESLRTCVTSRGELRRDHDEPRRDKSRRCEPLDSSLSVLTARTEDVLVHWKWRQTLNHATRPEGLGRSGASQGELRPTVLHRAKA